MKNLVSGSLLNNAATMALRQLLIYGSGIFFGRSLLDGDTAQAIAAVVLFAAVSLYGQVKGWVEQKIAIVLATEAASGEVVKHTGWLRTLWRRLMIVWKASGK